jgi:hypothetical protein
MVDGQQRQLLLNYRDSLAPVVDLLLDGIAVSTGGILGNAALLGIDVTDKRNRRRQNEECCGYAQSSRDVGLFHERRHARNIARHYARAEL